MPAPQKRRRYRKLVMYAAAILLSLFGLLLIFVDRFVEPILKDRIHTLIIQGSDSLYTYTLGKLKANFFGGNVEIEDLQISVDSSRYEYLRKRNALPSLTMRLSLGRGHIKGLGVMSLLFGKKIKITEILSKDANIKLTRHVHHNENDITEAKLPVWKAIQPKIKSIEIDRIRLEGIKMNYKNADTSESVKIEFEGCDALFDHIKIDSLSAFDTSRIGFTKEIRLKFQELKFRTQDSVYKLKADTVTYSSVQKTLEIKKFKFQPTLDSNFYENKTVQQSKYIIKFDRARFTNIRLDHFIHNNIIEADSAVFEHPDVNIYNDRSLIPSFESKIGKYPHQQLLKAASTIIIKNIAIKDAEIKYTEKNLKTGLEGKLALDNVQLLAGNVTNDRHRILQNPVCTASLKATLFGNSPLDVLFKFHLDSTNGKFEADGSIKKCCRQPAESIGPSRLPM
jgi:hypothetical protein